MATTTTSNPIIKTINRVLGRGPQKTANVLASLDSYPFGFIDSNSNIPSSKMGAAAAYSTTYEVNSCVRLIADAVAQLDWNIKHYPDGKRKGENGEVIANRADLISHHPLHHAMRHFSRDNNASLPCLAAHDYTLYGEFFIERTANIFGQNRSLEWLNPLGMNVQYTKKIDKFRYGWNQSYIEIEPERIAYLHNRNPNNDFIGWPIVLTCIDEINIARNLDRYLRDYFLNNARPGMVISPTSEETKFSKTDYDKLLNIIRNQLQGVGGQYNTVLLQVPVNADVFEQPDIAKNSGLNKEQSDAIFDAFHVPRVLCGNSQATAYKDSDDTMRWFYIATIIPLAASVIQPYINTTIMPFFDNSGDTIFEFDTSPFDEITQADMLEAQVVDIQINGTLIDLYTAAERQEIQPDNRLKGLYMVNNVPVPIEHLRDYWEKTLLVSPSPYGAEEITGKPLPEPSPAGDVIPTEEGGEPVASEETQETAEAVEELGDTIDETKSHNHNRLPHFKLYAGDKLFPPEDVIDDRLKRELHAWKRFEVNRITGRNKNKRNFITNIVPPWVRNEIIDRLDVATKRSEIETAFDTVLDDPVIKSLTSYQRGLREFGRGLWNDSISIGQFMSGMEDMIEREFTGAFAVGVHNGGLSVADLTPEERTERDTLISNEQTHIDGLAHYIYRNRKGVGKLDAIRSRVDRWVARYSRAKEVGYLIAKRAEPLLWQYDPRKDHCKSCKALNGQVRRASYWRKVGIEPNSDRLECFGIFCACKFFDPPEGTSISRGRLPRVGWRY